MIHDRFTVSDGYMLFDRNWFYIPTIVYILMLNYLVLFLVGSNREL